MHTSKPQIRTVGCRFLLALDLHKQGPENLTSFCVDHQYHPRIVFQIRTLPLINRIFDDGAVNKAHVMTSKTSKRNCSTIEVWFAPRTWRVMYRWSSFSNYAYFFELSLWVILQLSSSIRWRLTWFPLSHATRDGETSPSVKNYGSSFPIYDRWPTTWMEKHHCGAP